MIISWLFLSCLCCFKAGSLDLNQFLIRSAEKKKLHQLCGVAVLGVAQNVTVAEGRGEQGQEGAVEGRGCLEQAQTGFVWAASGGGRALPLGGAGNCSSHRGLFV